MIPLTPSACLDNYLKPRTWIQTDPLPIGLLVHGLLPLPSKGTNRAHTEAPKKLAVSRLPMVRAKLWVPAVTWCTPVVEQFSLWLLVWAPPSVLTNDTLISTAASRPAFEVAVAVEFLKDDRTRHPLTRTA